MSNKTQARRTTAEVAFGNLDLTKSIQKFLLSLSYTDNEEDKADSLTIKLQDRGLGWMLKWLDEAVQAATETEPEKKEEQEKDTAGTTYTVTARSGLNVRDAPGMNGKILGALSQGASVTVSEIKSGWASITYEGQSAYVSANYLKKNDATENQNADFITEIVGGRTVKALFTAYYPADNPQEGGFYAKRGERLNPSAHTCAAPEIIPFGTLITVQGTHTSRDGQTYEVNDRGGAITVKNGAYHIDLLMSTNDECNNFGVKDGMAIIGGAATRTRINIGNSAASDQPGGVNENETQAPEIQIYSSRMAQAPADKPSDISTGSVTQQTQSETSRTSKLRIQAAIVQKNWKSDGKDKVLDCGQFELDSITASGPPATVTIQATALPYRAAARNATRSKAWEKYKLSGIAQELAGVNGLICMYESANDPFYQRVEQYQQTDLNFLSDLCKKAGIALKLTNNIMILFDAAAYEAKDAVCTIKWGDGSYTAYDLKYDAGNTKYDTCRVSYTDPTSKQCIVGVAYADDYKEDAKERRQLEIREKVANKTAAIELAEKQLRLYNKYAQTASFTMVGNPDLVAGGTVQLEEFGSWNGKYIVRQAVHTLDANGYTTKIALRAVLPDSYSVTVQETTSQAGSVNRAAAATNAAAFIAAAAGEIGYHEGWNNRNKYGAWYGLNNEPWCVIFISWCADQTGAPIPKFSYVGDVSDYFKKKNQYRSARSGYIPKTGDLMIQSDRHIGIVEWADENAVHTIEGNYSNSVSRVTRSYGEITGFCTPWG